MDNKGFTRQRLDLLDGGALQATEQDGLRIALRAEADKECAWNAVWRKAQASRGRQPQARVLPLWKRVARVAAVVLPLAVATLFATVWQSGPDFTHYAAAGVADTISLADGSTVILGPGSELDFRIDGNSRQAQLSGIALFQVRHDEAQPFTVDASNATVRVLGTTFSVEHWPGEERVRTRVENGLVSMTAGSSEVKIKAGEEAIWSGNALSKTTSAASMTPIGQRNMVFRAATLEQVADELLTCYHGQLKGVRFECSADTALLTSAFANQSIESVVEELNLHFDKNFTLHNGYLTISD